MLGLHPELRLQMSLPYSQQDTNPGELLKYTLPLILSDLWEEEIVNESIQASELDRYPFYGTSASAV